VLALGLTVLFGSRTLGSGWTTDGPGAGYFPFYIGLILCISGRGILYQSLLGKKRNTERLRRRRAVRRVLVVLVPARSTSAPSAARPVRGLGHLHRLFMIFLGKFSKVKSVIAAVADHDVCSSSCSRSGSRCPCTRAC
jgi:hypothetical protein